jgi:hypothetical protein
LTTKRKINFWLPIEVSSTENKQSWLPREDISAEQTFGYQEKIVLQKINIFDSSAENKNPCCIICL